MKIVKSIQTRINTKIKSKLANKRFLALSGFIQLNNDFNLDVNLLNPRIESVDGTIFSLTHSVQSNTLPKEILQELVRHWPAIKYSCAGNPVLRSASIYRNLHVHIQYQNLVSSAGFGNAWHRDKIGRPNVQMFVLLHQTTSLHGPFVYVDSASMTDFCNMYPNLLNPKNRDPNFKIQNSFRTEFIGPRGSFCLINTFANFHTATIPEFGFQRDMLSLVFEPAAICSRPVSDVLNFQQIQKLTVQD